MKPRHLRRSLVDWEIVEGCVRAGLFLGGLYLMLFAALLFEAELPAF
jgi:hypothetical protein